MITRSKTVNSNIHVNYKHVSYLLLPMLYSYSICVMDSSSFRVLLSYCSFCNYLQTPTLVSNSESDNIALKPHKTQFPQKSPPLISSLLISSSPTTAILSKHSCFDTKNQTDTLNSWECNSNNIQLVRASMHAKKPPRHYFYSVVLLRKNQSPVTQVLKWPSERNMTKDDMTVMDRQLTINHIPCHKFIVTTGVILKSR